MASVPNKSRAAVLVDYGQPLQIREVEIPDPEPKAIVVRIEAATVCGTDVHIFRGHFAARCKLPLIPGHELIGRIVKLGRGRVRDAADQPLAEGDLIVWAYGWCGKCYYCTIAQQPTLCPYSRIYGRGSALEHPYLTGGFAEYAYVLPECQVVKVPEGIDARVAASATCALRTVVHNWERLGGLGIQESVVVLGCGPVGLYALAVAVVSGASEVTVIGAPQNRLDLARKWGAAHTINIEEVPDPQARLEQVRQWIGVTGPDVVVECSGSTAGFSQGLELARAGGRFLVIGTGGDNRVQVWPSHFNARQVRVMGTGAATIRHYHKAMLLLKNCRERFDFSAMISHDYSLEQINQALLSMEQMTDIKPALLPFGPAA